MMTTTIPLELFDKVIDDLESDTGALSAVSQTCRTLRPLCQKHIFSSIQLGPVPPGEHRRMRTIASFGDILDSNPIIAQYVRELLYDIEETDLFAMIVPHILDKLDHLESLTLSGHGGHWHELSPEFRQSLLNRFQSPRLTYLQIPSFNGIPTNIFEECASLTALGIMNNDVEGTQVETQVEDGNFTQNVLPRLHSFGFDVSNDYVRMLLQGSRTIPELSRLESVDIDVRGASDENQLAEIVLSAASNLKTLMFILDENSGGGLISSLSVSSFATLRTLRFNIFIYHQAQEALGGLCFELEAFPENNILETVEIYICTLCCSANTAGEHWGRLDDILSRRFPTLINFLLRVECKDALKEMFDNLPERKLPRLLEKSSVHFEYEMLREDGLISIPTA